MRPTAVPTVKVSPNINTLNIKTRTHDMLRKGYAKDISNLVMALIQQSEAKNADKNPERINGSRKSLKRNITFSRLPSGKVPICVIRHFSII